MPEIAEIETIKNDLIASGILGHKIVNIQIYSFSILQKITKQAFVNKLKNKTLLKIRRKGKYFIFDFKDLYLIIHLNMTGHIFLKDDTYKNQKHDHIIINFENQKKLIYFDPRRFGKFFLREDLSMLNKLGPDILLDEFVFDDFFVRLNKKSKKIKTLLLDQNFIAGLGNIYADEVLFEAKIHPEKIAKNIKRPKAKDLFYSILEVIKKAIHNRGTSLGLSKSNFSSINERFGTNQDYLLVHTKKTCPKCFSKINKIKINQRTSYYCKSCQKI